MLNAGGVSAAVGGLTMAVSRAHTTNWAHAMVLGVFGAFLSMFFMTPQIIEKISSNSSLNEQAGASVKEDTRKLTTAIKEYFRPAR